MLLSAGAVFFCAFLPPSAGHFRKGNLFLLLKISTCDGFLFKHKKNKNYRSVKKQLFYSFVIVTIVQNFKEAI